MTDFLNRLAERTLGLTPRVMPLLASRYSPSPSIEPIEETFTEEPQRAIKGRSDRARPPTSLLNDTQISSQIESKKASLEKGGTIAMDQPSINLDEPIDLASLEPNSLRREPTTNVINQLPKREDRVMRATAQWSMANSAESMWQRSGNPKTLQSETKENGDRSNQDGINPDGINPDRLNQGGLEPKIVSSLSASEISESEQNHTGHNHTGQNHDQGRAESLRRGMLIQTVMERAAQQVQAVTLAPKTLVDNGQSFSPPNELERPVIRVTIGRVEVRAIMLPAPSAEAPKTARTSPVLGLDAFLKQQSGRAP